MNYQERIMQFLIIHALGADNALSMTEISSHINLPGPEVTKIMNLLVDRLVILKTEESLYYFPGAMVALKSEGEIRCPGIGFKEGEILPKI